MYDGKDKAEFVEWTEKNIHNEMGSTKRTLFEIILFKLDTFFPCVLRVNGTTPY
jgi:hypothetical protein